MSGRWIVTDIEPEEADESDSQNYGLQSGTEKFLCKEVNHEENGVKGHAKSKWLSGAWPVTPFDGTLDLNKRKAEWIRFRDQFERIVSCKESVDSKTKLTGLKIHAGGYLVDIVEMHEKQLQGNDDVYNQIVTCLNSYFNKICDPDKERMLFREMRMKSSEPFMDWVLRLEKQSKYCEFTDKQRQEEFLLALLKRSIPAIGVELYKMSEVFEKNIERIVNHGQHLDHIRRETEELNKNNENTVTSEELHSVNVLRYGKSGNLGYNRDPPRKFNNQWNNRETRRAPDYRRTTQCSKCGEHHQPGRCRAYRVKCHNCERYGHFQKCCRTAPRARTFSKFSSPRHDDKKPEDVKKEINQINQVSASDSE